MSSKFRLEAGIARRLKVSGVTTAKAERICS